MPSLSTGGHIFEAKTSSEDSSPPLDTSTIICQGDDEGEGRRKSSIVITNFVI